MPGPSDGARHPGYRAEQPDREHRQRLTFRANFRMRRHFMGRDMVKCVFLWYASFCEVRLLGRVPRVKDPPM